uniref:Double-strand break repair protein n=1 Tax=Culicoides sonorensis TaxID=179676 RepID=A0A336LS54_CULSO
MVLSQPEINTNESNATSTGSSVNPDDVISILLASDIHLGHKEDDKERGEDSYNAFEELLQIAVAKNVDFILLGGDLFDKANPSSYCFNRCMALLRTYCMGGEKPIMVEFLSDQSVNFAESLNKTVNYEDPNLNISIPVFSIHGNHDDPSGFNNTSAMDLLSTAGLINYFGKLTNLKELKVDPVMLQKGETKLAIFGLSFIPDNRLTRLFDDKKVTLSVPPNHETEWFNIFVLHQNRANRGVKNYLAEESLPDLIDFIVWGHEHDCRIEPEQNFKKRFYVSQPGSTVATSLAEGEAGIKKVAILQICQKNFKIEPIPLKSVRPFVFDTLNMAKIVNDEEFLRGKLPIEEKVQNLAREKIKEMLKEAEKLRTGHPKQPIYPLIRLRIDVTDSDQMFQSIRFGQPYSKIVANHNDMITFKRSLRRKIKDDGTSVDADVLEEAYIAQDGSKSTKVDDVVRQYFEEVDESKKLKLFSMDSMAEMTRLITVGTSKTQAIWDFYEKKALEYTKDCMSEDFEQKLAEFRANDAKTFKEMIDCLDMIKGEVVMDIDNNDDDDDDGSPSVQTTSKAAKTTPVLKPPPPARGRGSRGGRGRGTSRNVTALNISTTSKARAAPKNNTIILDSDESD